MDSPVATAPGLRERKRAATAKRVVEAATALVDEHGYDHVTVEMICSASEISQGTFFNYFGSKEGVFLGPEMPMPSASAIETFVAGSGNALADLFVMVTEDVLVGPQKDKDLMMAQRCVVAETPALSGLEVARFAAAEEYFTQLILRRFATAGRQGSDQELRREATTIAQLGFMVGRRVMEHWVAQGDFGAARDIATSEIALIHRLTETHSPTETHSHTDIHSLTDTGNVA